MEGAVRGVRVEACRIQRDAAYHAWLESGQNLLPRGSSTGDLDRYDARCLLDPDEVARKLQSRSNERCRDQSAEHLHEQCEAERWRDLLLQQYEQEEERGRSGAGKYASVGFSYDSGGTAAPVSETAGVADGKFKIEFDVPAGTVVPAEEKTYKLVMHVSSRIAKERARGSEFEAELRRRALPHLSFLVEGDAYHAFYVAAKQSAIAQESGAACPEFPGVRTPSPDVVELMRKLASNAAVEDLFRTRERHNPMFSFLFDGDNDARYYALLKEHLSSAR